MIRPLVVLVAAILLLGPLLAVELGLRALIANDRLPEAPSSEPVADMSLANLARQGRPDVLVLGNSSTHNAISPAVLEGLIERDGGAQARVFNAALSGLVHEDQRALVQGLAERDLLPEVVVVGLSPTGGTARYDREGWLATSELGRLWTGCADLAGYEQVSCQVGQRSALWRWRGRTEQVRQALAGPRETTISGAGRTVLENGWVSAKPAAAERLDGLLEDTLARLDAEVVRSPAAEAEFAALVADLRALGSEVVVVATPYSEPLLAALTERNPDWPAQLAESYAGMAEAAAVEIIELPEPGDAWQPRWQRDHRHVSRVGAKVLTEQLWADPRFREPMLAALAPAGGAPDAGDEGSLDT